MAPEPRTLPTDEEIREEQRRLRYLRTLVDLTASLIMQGRFGRSELEQMVEATRRQILALFPGKEETFELLYRSRFERLIQEYAVEPAEGTPPSQDPGGIAFPVH